MATRRLLHWMVEYYSTAPHPYVCVTLRGYERRGLMHRRSQPILEQLRLPFEGRIPAGYGAQQAQVRSAMRHSTHRWHGRIP
jgi:hypothetical protein